MLIGEYLHTLDPKKRLSLPSKWRKELGKKVIVTHGLDHCLFVYSLKEWAGISDKIASLPWGAADTRKLSRFFLSGATEVEVDSAGRILVSERQKAFAGLDTKVILAGVHDRVEIWNEEKWNSYREDTESEADALAEKLGEVGAL